METKTFTYGSYKVTVDLEPFKRFDGEEASVFYAHVKWVETAGWWSYKGTFEMHFWIDGNTGDLWGSREYTVQHQISNSLSIKWGFIELWMLDRVPAHIIAGFIRGDVKQFDEVVTTQSQLNELIAILANAGEHDSEVILMNHFAGRFGPPDLTL